jgi:hypothetical protein
MYVHSVFEVPLEKGMDLIVGEAVINSSGVTHISLADTNLEVLYKTKLTGKHQTDAKRAIIHDIREVTLP